jgi:hypothetical protein
MYRSSVETYGSGSEPDYVYYNADIINNRTDDATFALTPSPDPPIRFNETRDAPLIKNAHNYHFSIVRFTMNGANRDLPLFIPNIQTGQPDVNLTTYASTISYQATWTTNLGATSFNIAPPATALIYQPETINIIQAPVPPAPLVKQDLSTRYYWVYTYQHMVDLVNQTFLNAHQAVFTAFQAAWAAVPGLTDPFPFANFAAFQASVQTPKLVYQGESNQLFQIYGDSAGFGQPLEPFVVVPYVAGTASLAARPQYRLFFNTNLYGLFANFQNLYWNSTNITAYNVPGQSPAFTLPALGTVPVGYTNEILFPNKNFQNVADYRITPYAGVPPLGYVPPSQQKVWWIAQQDYKSVDSIWSPISSIVFTSTLLPLKYEATGAPVLLGTSNTGDSTAAVQNAFLPIITDIALDQTLGGADDYRQFIYYAPNAEYRMADFGASNQEIRNIDVQVYWKNRLDNNLYPITMFNLSSVSLKVMFRRRDYVGKDTSL